jgi:hypothetical protein
MTHEEKIARWIDAGAVGTEIGPGSAPVPGLTPPPLYVDCFKSFGAHPTQADYYGHACSLPFHDHALDYVIASHVLEHVANPVAALAEWHRVVRHDGIIYLIVPDRRVTWDRPRALTTVEHLLADYVAGTTAADATHIDEFVSGVDWSQFSPTTAAEDRPARQAELAAGMHAAVARGEDINIHFHTFEPSNLRALLDTLAAQRGTTPPGPPRLGWEIVDFAEYFPSTNPNGVLAILRVRKGWRARADAEALRIRAQGDARAVLRPDARPFAQWAAATPGLGGVK